MLIDTHCHLMEPHFEADVASVIERSALAGVLKLMNIGCNIAGSEKSAEMCTPQYATFLRNTLGENVLLPEIFGSQGIHPHDSNQATDEIMAKFLRVIQENKRIVVIGETGLDYFYMKQSREIQLESLRKHMKLARETGLPVSIHCRDAEKTFEAREDMLMILAEFPGVRCVMHCFSQDRAYAEEILAKSAGHILSFGGTSTYAGAASDEVRKVAISTPPDRIVIETDCPYLTPQTLRGKRNEPAFMVETAKFLAVLRGESLEDFARMTSVNATAFFSL